MWEISKLDSGILNVGHHVWFCLMRICQGLGVALSWYTGNLKLLSHAERGRNVEVRICMHHPWPAVFAGLEVNCSAAVGLMDNCVELYVIRAMVRNMTLSGQKDGQKHDVRRCLKHVIDALSGPLTLPGSDLDYGQKL